ncbi:DNA polymerase Y family protein [Buchananella hordeovulneris]|uniref:DNA polymerase Y family protein n=2 Tax=Buchananella hordeovulneris TaxID=52770 RepID=UPI0026DAD1C4|nr:DNA polymerase Y family protein [Buchananella hordeovulneris]MDO5081182.1 DNA polymerase Y family protein [Buchananella hordeovulneris]
MSGREWLCAWVPNWPLAALLVGAPELAAAPVALTVRNRIRAATPAAAHRGVQPGMTVRTAHELCPELAVHRDDPARQTRVFEQVLRDLDEVVAAVHVVRPGLVLVPARGPARWAGGREQLAEKLGAAVAEGSGQEVQVGGGCGTLTAILAAQAQRFIPAGQEQQFLAPWPLRAAGRALPGHDLTALQQTLDQLGIRTLGQLAQLPAAQVADRFGQLGQLLHRLASGNEVTPTRPADRPRDFAVTRELDPPVHRADVAAFVAKSLVAQFLAGLAERGQACASLEIAACTTNGTWRSRIWSLTAPPSATDLTDRVRWQLDGWLAARPAHSGDGPLHRLRLRGTDTYPASGAQAGLWGKQTAAEQAANRAALRLQGILGPAAVVRPFAHPGNDPRSRTGVVAWGESLPSPPSQPGPWPHALPAPSPTLLPATPPVVRLLDAAAAPVTIQADGTLSATPTQLLLPAATDFLLPAGRYQITGYSWPWVFSGQWWLSAGLPARAYLALETDRGPALLLTHWADTWHLDGVYD